MNRLLIFFLLFLYSIIGCKPKPTIEDESTEKYTILVGTYTQKEGHVDGKGTGVYLLEITPQLKSYSLVDSIVGLVNPSYLDVNTQKSRAVIANEVVNGYQSGWLTLVDISTHGFGTILDTLSSGGFAPCHVTIDDDVVRFTNYIGGMIGEATINNDRFDNIIYSKLLYDSESNHPRQEASHPHSSLTTQDGGFTYIADLGTDKVWIINNKDFIQNDHELDYFLMPSGSGPRHMTISSDEKYLYVINELNNTIATLIRNKRNGSLTLMGSMIECCGNEFVAKSYCADIHISNDNQHLYTSNRGQNVISVYKLSPLPEFLKHESTKGSTPRNFTLTSDGKYLFAANQDSNDMTVFQISSDGQLEYLFTVPIKTPVCLVEL